jgi:hypothetical protein
MNQDDDSILDRLLNELDIDSALLRLKRIGFRVMLSPNDKKRYYHLHRCQDDAEEYEDIFIQTNSRNHFLIKYVYQGQVATCPETITTWDEWVAFVRQLMFKAPKRRIEQARHKEEKEDNESPATKRLKCAEQ